MRDLARCNVSGVVPDGTFTSSKLLAFYGPVSLPAARLVVAMAVHDWHDDDTDDEDDVLLGVVVSPVPVSPRVSSGGATSAPDRPALGSLVSTLGKPGGLYGGSVLGFHERNAGTTAFSPAAGNITRAVASGVVSPGPGRISLAAGGSPRVGVRAPRDDESDGEGLPWWIAEQLQSQQQQSQQQEDEFHHRLHRRRPSFYRSWRRIKRS